MAFINEAAAAEVSKRLAGLDQPVHLINFTQTIECTYCEDTRRLMEELAALSDKLSLEVYNFIEDKDKAEAFQVDKIPATLIRGEQDPGIRFFGIPSGYEFPTLLEAIMMVSKGDSGLSAATREQLAALTQPLHLQVFITPTWPYCPQVVHLAHQFAMESGRVVADMVEATEFPHLSHRYNVRGVPKTVVNDQSAVEGAVTEALFLEQVLQAAERAPSA